MLQSRLLRTCIVCCCSATTSQRQYFSTATIHLQGPPIYPARAKAHACLQRCYALNVLSSSQIWRAELLCPFRLRKDVAAAHELPTQGEEEFDREDGNEQRQQCNHHPFLFLVAFGARIAPIVVVLLFPPIVSYSRIIPHIILRSADLPPRLGIEHLLIVPVPGTIIRLRCGKIRFIRCHRRRSVAAVQRHLRSPRYKTGRGGLPVEERISKG
mmetsp:Transcript_61685/g.182229  ORF Transcript_61685/g.182229 Transcript_61685/m.182229 type:complete len:213 (-) Transcript_61685:651-1289(-)